MSKFYKCNHCGRIVEEIAAGADMTCCGEVMVALVANSVDAAKEKHVPVTNFVGDDLIVEVGSVAHPMTPEHWIQWIHVCQDGHHQRVDLTPECSPKVSFKVNPGRPVEVFAYCNLHGLWKA